MSDVREPSGSEAAERIEEAKTIFDRAATLSLAICDRGEPWIGRVFFVEDEPASGRLDLCCAVVETPHTMGMLEAGVSVAFLVGEEEPDRWINGSGIAALIDDEDDAAAIAKRLADKSPLVSPFLERVQTRAVRIRVRRLKLTDLATDPPVAEFTFE